MIDVKTQEGWQTIANLSSLKYKRYDFNAFLKKGGQHDLCYDGHPLFYVKSVSAILIGNALHYASHRFPLIGDDVLDPLKKNFDFAPCAVILPKGTPRKKENREYHTLVILNGDEHTNEIHADPVIYPHTKGMPTVSFECLRQLISDPKKPTKRAVVADKLASGELRIVDYTLDETRPLTKEERKLKANRKPVKSPLGFSPILNLKNQYVWHRAATVLVEDKATERFYLIGQDEGTYFGVVMPPSFGTGTTTVKSAFNALIPQEVRGKRYKRQGEWFLVAVPEKKVPPKSKCICTSEDSVYLPLESDDSNGHAVLSCDIRVDQTGIYAYNCTLKHSEHNDVEVDGWVTFYRNTADRSVSIQGVD